MAALVGAPSQPSGAKTCGDPSTRLGPSLPLGVLRANVDGSGGKERVFIAFDGRRHDRCRFRLVVDFDRQAATPIAGPAWLARASKDDAFRGLRLHSLIALAPRGLDIVVVHDRGASTDQLGMYTLVGGRLRPRAVAGGTRLYEGGTVTRLSTIDCVRRRSNLVRSTGAGFDGARWRVARTVYRATSAGPLRPIPALTRRASARRLASLRSRYPELRAGTAQGSAFRSCALVRNPR